MTSSFYGCKGGSFLFSARIVKANERKDESAWGEREPFFRKVPSPPNLPLSLPRLSRLSNPRLRPFPVRREGQSAGCRKKPGNEKPGMTSIPGFRNCPGGGTQGRGEPQHDIVGRFHVRMASASGRKIWKNGSEMPPHTFSQEVHGGRFGEGASGRRPSPSASAIRLLRPQSCGRRAFRVPCGESRCSTRHPCGSR